MSAIPPHAKVKRIRTRPTPASAACPDRTMAASSNSTKQTNSPTSTVSKVATNVLIPISSLRHLFSDRHEPFPLPCLCCGSSLSISSGRLRRTPSRVRLNRPQRHRLKDRSGWFIGVHSEFMVGKVCAVAGSFFGSRVRREKASYRSTLNSRARARAWVRFLASSFR